MKWFQNIETLTDLRKEYRRLVVKYHPDNNSGSEDAMKQINKEYDTLFKRLKNDFEQKDTYNGTSEKQKQQYDWQKDAQIRDLIMQLAKFKDISVEIIGTWIWISDCYQYHKELKELGFRWAREKKRWYIHFDDYYKFGSKPASMSYIRSKYGSVEIRFKADKEDSFYKLPLI